MTTQQKLEKKGYKIVFMSGTRNGNLSIVGVKAYKPSDAAKRFPIYAENITQLYKSI